VQGVYSHAFCAGVVNGFDGGDARVVEAGNCAADCGRGGKVAEAEGICFVDCADSEAFRNGGLLSLRGCYDRLS